MAGISNVCFVSKNLHCVKWKILDASVEVKSPGNIVSARFIPKVEKNIGRACNWSRLIGIFWWIEWISAIFFYSYLPISLAKFKVCFCSCKSSWEWNIYSAITGIIVWDVQIISWSRQLLNKSTVCICFAIVGTSVHIPVLTAVLSLQVSPTTLYHISPQVVSFAKSWNRSEMQHFFFLSLNVGQM